MGQQWRMFFFLGMYEYVNFEQIKLKQAFENEINVEVVGTRLNILKICFFDLLSFLQSRVGIEDIDI